MKRRKICAVTTSRADFGLLRGLLKAIRDDSALRLQVIASGMHLSPKFGRTWRDIEAEGIPIDRKISLRLTGESSLDNLKSIGVGLKGFAEAFAELQPEIVVLLGDRFELFAPAISAMMLQIPIAHIHGGELSEGVTDDFAVQHLVVTSDNVGVWSERGVVIAEKQRSSANARPVPPIQPAARFRST